MYIQLCHICVAVAYDYEFVTQVCEKLALVPGKLDHATVVAYNVGPYDRACPPPSPLPLVLPLDSKTHLNLRHNTRTIGEFPGIFVASLHGSNVSL